jgi:plastocyanin
MQRLVGLLGAATLALVLAACSSGPSGPSVPPQSLSADSPSIVAKDVKFTTTTVNAPANKPFAIDFDNQDSVPHNVTIVDAKGAIVFKGDIFSGPSHKTYSVAALAPGAYAFKCDVHPDMAGALVAQ